MNNLLLEVSTLRLLFEGDWVKPCLLLALMCGCVVVGVAMYLSRITRESYFGLWTLAWMFYCVYLAACLALAESSNADLLNILRYACVGITALFVFWGSFNVTRRPRQWRELGLGAIGILLWSAVAVVTVQEEFWITMPIFGLLAWASVYMAFVYFSNRKTNRGTWLVAAGFVLWAVHSLGFPFAWESSLWKAVGYAIWGISALSIAIGMVVEQELAVSEKKYRELFDSSPEAIFVVDMATHDVLDMNFAAQRLSGREIESLLGKSFLDVCPNLKQEKERSPDAHRMYSAVFRPYTQFAIARPNGAQILCEGEMRPSRHGKRPAIQIHVREVGQNARMGQQLRRAEKLSSLGQLVAGVAHELNNPLAVVVGYAQLLSKRSEVDPKVRSELGKVLNESERAAKIVKNLLTFVRPAEPQLVPVDINRLVNSVLDARQRDFVSSKITVEKRLAETLPATKADPSQLEQVLTNLIINAVQAMAPKPGTLAVKTEENGFNVRISVSDTGTGVPKTILGQIFDPFFTTKAPGKGTGLGLTISNGIVEEHKGRIWVENNKEKGATFIVELPIVPCGTAPAPAEPVPAERTPDPRAADRRLLIVDDEPGIVDVLVEVLGGNGYTVETANNGAEALNRIASNRYDLIISDLCMPEVDGRKLYEAVHEKDPELASRIIFVTGDTVSNNSRAFLEKTGSTWLSKPFSIGEVEELVSNFLQRDAALAGVN